MYELIIFNPAWRGQNPIGGGVNQELINRISDIESRLLDLTDKLAGLESTHADKENYGLVRLSDASSVTQMSGLALPATEFCTAWDPGKYDWVDK